METVRMKWGKASSLGIRWTEVCDKMGYNIYAINEGRIDDDTKLEIPMSLVVTAIANK